MKEYTKKVLLLVVICVATLAVLVVALKLHENKMNNLLSESEIKNYLTEIKYEEIKSHVTEMPDRIIYVTNSSEEESKTFNKIFIPVIKKYNLENEVIHINLNGTTIVDPVYQYAPELIFYQGGEISDIIDCSTIDSSKDLTKVLKERSVISD